MDITGYTLTDGEWEVSDTVQNMILCEGGKDVLNFEHQDTKFVIAFEGVDMKVTNDVAFDKMVEGSVNTYEWIKSQTVEANKEIPVYGMVRVKGETAKEFSLEDFKNQKDYDEGIVFTVSLR
ncbi:MAG: hypothetical protein IKG46_08060 [Solobacterium sp.]|nr:hypothetical protein [Solobacterium sp.]